MDGGKDGPIFHTIRMKGRERVPPMVYRTSHQVAVCTLQLVSYEAQAQNMHESHLVYESLDEFVHMMIMKGITNKFVWKVNQLCKLYRACNSCRLKIRDSCDTTWNTDNPPSHSYGSPSRAYLSKLLFNSMKGTDMFPSCDLCRNHDHPGFFPAFIHVYLTSAHVSHLAVVPHEPCRHTSNVRLVRDGSI